MEWRSGWPRLEEDRKIGKVTVQYAHPDEDWKNIRLSDIELTVITSNCLYGTCLSMKIIKPVAAECLSTIPIALSGLMPRESERRCRDSAGTGCKKCKTMARGFSWISRLRNGLDHAR